jgi:hypothetical protein
VSYPRAPLLTTKYRISGNIAQISLSSFVVRPVTMATVTPASISERTVLSTRLVTVISERTSVPSTSSAASLIDAIDLSFVVLVCACGQATRCSNPRKRGEPFRALIIQEQIQICNCYQKLSNERKIIAKTMILIDNADCRYYTEFEDQ